MAAHTGAEVAATTRRSLRAQVLPLRGRRLCRLDLRITVECAQLHAKAARGVGSQTSRENLLLGLVLAGYVEGPPAPPFTAPSPQAHGMMITVILAFAMSISL